MSAAGATGGLPIAQCRLPIGEAAPETSSTRRESRLPFHSACNQASVCSITSSLQATE